MISRTRLTLRPRCSGPIQKNESAQSLKRRPIGDIAVKCRVGTGLLSATAPMNSVLLEMVVFADAPVDLTITSKAKIKNSSAAIHHIISYRRILCCAVVFAGRVFDLLYDTMMMGVRCGGTTLFEIRVTFYGFPSEFNWRDRSRSLRPRLPGRDRSIPTLKSSHVAP